MSVLVVIGGFLMLGIVSIIGYGIRELSNACDDETLFDDVDTNETEPQE